MTINSFEDIKCWERSRILVGKIYGVFKNNRDLSFRDQIQRAAVSIMNNIAEGFERQSNKDFRKFLFVSKGSCAEVRSMLYLALDLGYISKSELDELSAESREISKMLSGFIKTL
jgi:four helix bundle protein